MGPYSLKPKPTEALVGHWHREGLSVGTRKNCMAVLRWWARKVDCQRPDSPDLRALSADSRPLACSAPSAAERKFRSLFLIHMLILGALAL